MQHISVILAHPYTHSLNAAIAATVVATLEKNGYSVHFHDLYQEGFNPLINGQELVADDSSDPLLRQHQEEICRAHGIIIVHPNWWGQPPALLKGWGDHRPTAGQSRLGLQHLKHPRPARTGRLRRPARAHLERLHLRLLRRPRL